MGKRNINNLLPKAIAVAKKELADSGTTIPKEYNGYISSFGASVSQAGLLSSVAFFENKNANAQQDRTKLMKAIALLIGHDGALIDYVTKHPKDKEKILDAAVALKLAIRTFELSKGSSDGR